MSILIELKTNITLAVPLKGFDILFANLNKQ